jgi:hypothetical protein
MTKKEKGNLAEQWAERIDRIDNSSIIEKMCHAAVDEQEYGGSYLYIFEDGSSLYEKHRDDWREGETYVRCPECEVWRELDDTYISDICNDCDEEIVAINK